METDELVKTICAELELRKAENTVVLNVKNITTITDSMIIVTASSERHAQALSHYVIEKLKEIAIRSVGTEGGQGTDWVLLDVGNVIVHCMTAAARERYQLEKLWSVATRAHETAPAMA